MYLITCKTDLFATLNCVNDEGLLSQAFAAGLNKLD